MLQYQFYRTISSVILGLADAVFHQEFRPQLDYIERYTMKQTIWHLYKMLYQPNLGQNSLKVERVVVSASIDKRTVVKSYPHCITNSSFVVVGIFLVYFDIIYQFIINGSIHEAMMILIFVGAALPVSPKLQLQLDFQNIKNKRQNKKLIR